MKFELFVSPLILHLQSVVKFDKAFINSLCTDGEFTYFIDHFPTCG